jgi:TRAP-type C4-dicarboxylate transport system permease small subunit
LSSLRHAARLEKPAKMKELGATGSPRPHAWDKVWPKLDRLYLSCGYLAAFFLVLIFLTTMLQVASRFLGYNISGLTEYAGYFMAASAFLAFAHTFNHGAHIRIELFLSMMGRFRKIAEWFSFGVAVVTALWLSWFAWSMVYWSYKFNELSQGLDATPIWIPQLSMAIGLTVLALSIVDHMLRLILTGDHRLPTSPDAL